MHQETVGSFGGRAYHMVVRQPAQFIHIGVSWAALKGPGLCGFVVVLSFGSSGPRHSANLQRPRTVRRSRRALRRYEP